MREGAPRTIPLPAEGQVDIWSANLEGEIGRCAEVLSRAEAKRFSWRNSEGRRRFARSHAALREVVAEYLGVAGADVELTAPYGLAPTVAGGLCVSLTHSEDIALVAVASVPVGIDVETVEVAEDEDLDDLAEVALTDAELKEFRGLATGRPQAFLRLWSRKEAVLKARGQGLGSRLPSDVEAQGRRSEGLTLADFELRPPYLGAVAVQHSRVEITWREWQG